MPRKLDHRSNSDGCTWSRHRDQIAIFDKTHGVGVRDPFWTPTPRGSGWGPPHQMGTSEGHMVWDPIGTPQNGPKNGTILDPREVCVDRQTQIWIPANPKITKIGPKSDPTRPGPTQHSLPHTHQPTRPRSGPPNLDPKKGPNLLTRTQILVHRTKI